jgi:chromosome segregation ATPase
MTTPSSIEERIARLEGSFEQIERRLGTLEQDLRSFRAEVNVRFESLEATLTARIDRVESRLEARIDRLFYGLLGAVAASILATVLARLL